MEIIGLYVYPVKGCRGTALQEAIFDAQGFRFDRRWMIVDAKTGRFITQREVSLLARIVPMATEEALILSYDDLTTLTLSHLPDSEMRCCTITVWGFTGEALDCGDTVADWLTTALNTPCRLVRTPEDFTRRIHPDYGTPEDRVGFADGYSVLLATTPSLDDLNQRLMEKGAEPVPMERFRPNIVVRGTTAWEEDNWQALTVAETGLTFRGLNPCGRCVVTTIDQTTGEKTGVEPLATLSQFRRNAGGKVKFAINLVHDQQNLKIPLRLGETMIAG